mgnify:CR=1 FL=1
MFKNIRNTNLEKIYKYLILNNLIFFFLSIIILKMDVQNYQSLIPIIFYLLGSGTLALIFFIGNYKFLPIALFNFCSFLFIGLGTLISFLKYDFLQQSNSILVNLSDLKDVNILNSLSLLTISIISYLFIYNKNINDDKIKKNDFVLNISKKRIIHILVFLLVFLIF